MEIKNMEPCHVPQVAALEKLCFSDPWSEGSVAGELDNPLSCWLVAMEGERVVGYVGSQTVLGETDMMNIAVHPDCRRAGVGQALIRALIRALKERDSCCLTLEVRESNAPARSLYEKMGFSQVGLRNNYYRSPRENACILQKRWDGEMT